MSGVNYQWQDKTGPLWGMGLPARTRIYLRRREYYIYNPGGRRVAACPVRLYSRNPGLNILHFWLLHSTAVQ